MKYGLTPEQYHFIEEEVVGPLESLGAKVWVFGSRARGDHKKFSGLDLMVETENDVRFVISQIDEMLIESSFPYKVEIVIKNDFEQSYIENFENEKVEF